MFLRHQFLFALVVLQLSACGGEGNPAGLADEVTRPVYLEARMKETQSGIEAVFIAATASQTECQARTALAMFSRCPTCKFTKMSCADELPSRFQNVWDGKPYRATYMIFTHGEKGERDGRLIFFSVPSSVVAGACPAMEARIRETYKGTIECRKGTIG